MSAPIPSRDAARALDTLRTLGFRLDTTTGSYRLIRTFDSSQAQLYSLTGSTPTAADGLPIEGSGNLGNLLHFDSAELSQMAISGLALARAILKDEATRLTQMNQFQKPSIESRPYG
jgi:hypothetical protein